MMVSEGGDPLSTKDMTSRGVAWQDIEAADVQKLQEAHRKIEESTHHDTNETSEKDFESAMNEKMIKISAERKQENARRGSLLLAESNILLKAIHDGELNTHSTTQNGKASESANFHSNVSSNTVDRPTGADKTQESGISSKASGSSEKARSDSSSLPKKENGTGAPLTNSASLNHAHVAQPRRQTFPSTQPRDRLPRDGARDRNTKATQAPTTEGSSGLTKKTTPKKPSPTLSRKIVPREKDATDASALEDTKSTSSSVPVTESASETAPLPADKKSFLDTRKKNPRNKPEDIHKKDSDRSAAQHTASPSLADSEMTTSNDRHRRRTLPSATTAAGETTQNLTTSKQRHSFQSTRDKKFPRDNESVIDKETPSSATPRSQTTRLPKPQRSSQPTLPLSSQSKTSQPRRASVKSSDSTDFPAKSTQSSSPITAPTHSQPSSSLKKDGLVKPSRPSNAGLMRRPSLDPRANELSLRTAAQPEASNADSSLNRSHPITNRMSRDRGLNKDDTSVSTRKPIVTRDRRPTPNPHDDLRSLIPSTEDRRRSSLRERRPFVRDSRADTKSAVEHRDEAFPALTSVVPVMTFKAPAVPMAEILKRKVEMPVKTTAVVVEEKAASPVIKVQPRVVLFRVDIETKSGEQKPLVVHKEDDARCLATVFCEQQDMMDVVDELVSYIEDHQKRLTSQVA